MTELFEKGREVRSQVLGAKYVERALGTPDPFMGDFQHFVTQFVWGAVWAREGLSHRTRSMLNIALLTALNRQNDLKLHIQTALSNGVTPDEIKEILLHCAVYAGVPAAFDGFLLAREAVAKFEAENGKEKVDVA